MSARTIGQVLAGAEAAKARRTFQPVRRKSYHVGTREHTIWKPIGDGSKRGGRRFWGALMRAAEIFDDEGKQPGKVNGPLGHVALRILREMGRRADFKTGRIDPSIDTIMEWTRRSRAAICRALTRLKNHGFLDWIRRTEPIEDPDPFGPQVRQVSNAYGIDIKRLPEKAAALMRRLLARGTPPDDATWAREQDTIETEAMYGALPMSEQGTARLPGTKLGAALDSLGAAFERQNASSPDGQNPETEG